MTPEASLRAVPHFEHLEAFEVEALAHALEVREYPDGHVFIREGEPGGSVFLLLDGTVQVCREEGGGATELNRLRPNELFGLVALVDDAPRSATCRSAGPTRVGSWPRTAAALLMAQHAPIAKAFQMALATQLAKDFRQLDRRVRDRFRR